GESEGEHVEGEADSNASVDPPMADDDTVPNGSVAAAEPSPPAEEEEEARDTLVVFLALRDPAHRSRVIEALRDAGHEAEPEADDEVALIIERSAFETLFQARIGSTTTGASASNRTITVMTLDSYRTPRSIRRWVRNVYFDPQR
ncbi:MAG: hypothetical protein AAF645_18870, partial [Myxococcota bacterium]